jgi:hypothetical protein
MERKASGLILFTENFSQNFRPRDGQSVHPARVVELDRFCIQFKGMVYSTHVL